MANYLKYIYIALIITIAIILIVLFSKLKQLMIKCAGLSNNIDSLKENADITSTKIQGVKKSKESWQFFINIWIILTVLKETIKLFKKFTNEGIKKAFVVACAKNAIKITKMI